MNSRCPFVWRLAGSSVTGPVTSSVRLGGCGAAEQSGWESFYSNLGSMTKADALRQAKLATMKEYPNPFHWAAFCLQGDYR